MWKLTDTKARSSPLLRRLRRLSAGERREEAVAFIRRFHRENGLSDTARRKREGEVTRHLKRFATYEMTPEELAFGARLAWRNHAQCIGRLYWTSLEVVDCRHVVNVDEIVNCVVNHMSEALGDGRIRSMMTVFAPMRNTSLPAYIESAQIIQYAGYVNDDGHRIGDRQNIELTRMAMSLGWRPPQPRGMFDRLPLLVRDQRERRLLYEVPSNVVREVALSHPDYPAIGELELRWYSVPCVSGMIMTIGGVDYPCAPFNGFYMSTEIASRDLVDENRYDLLPTIGRAIGEDPDAPGVPFWKDRALTELNRAVLHSFESAGVTIIDHHTASSQYMEFVRREHAAGREASGDWAWIVPPQASSACPVFHLPMVDKQNVPNFYHSRATDGGRLVLDRSDEHRSWMRLRYDYWKRHYRDWRRTWD